MNLAMIVVEIAGHFRATLCDRVWSCPYDHVRSILQSRTDSLQIPANTSDAERRIVGALAQSFWFFPMRIVHDESVLRSSAQPPPGHMPRDEDARDSSPAVPYTPGRLPHDPPKQGQSVHS